MNDGFKKWKCSKLAMGCVLILVTNFMIDLIQGWCGESCLFMKKSIVSICLKVTKKNFFYVIVKKKNLNFILILF